MHLAENGCAPAGGSPTGPTSCADPIHYAGAVTGSANGTSGTEDARAMTAMAAMNSIDGPPPLANDDPANIVGPNSGLPPSLINNSVRSHLPN